MMVEANPKGLAFFVGFSDKHQSIISIPLFIINERKKAVYLLFVSTIVFW
jgi:hypothetical protein